MMSKSRVPQIRFKGFNEEWEENTINNLGDIVTGSTPKTQDKSNYCGEYLFVSPADIQNNRYIESTITTLSLKGHKLGRILEKNSVLFVSIGSTIGKVAQIKNKATTNQQINAINPNKYNDSNFIYSMLVNKSDRIKKLASAQAVPIINKTSFSEIEILIPHIAEQTKIGNYFQQLDKLIEQKEKKYQKLKQFKKAMLDKMFPKNGANTPEVRFKGFTGKWEEKELGEVVEIVMGQSPCSKSYNTDKKGIPLIQGNADIYNRFSNPRNWTTEKTKECKIGDLILTVRAPVGAIAKSIHDACIGRGVCAIKNNINSTNEFIYQFLLDYEKKWSILEQGSTFTAVSGTEIKKVKIKLPNIKEQEKIGNYFQKLDNQIDLQQKELEKLKNIKKASLSKMFV